MKYRKYDEERDQRPDLDPKPFPQEHGTYWNVTARRRVSPGQLTVKVRATSAAEAKLKLENGEVPGIGLGWQVLGTPTPA